MTIRCDVCGVDNPTTSRFCGACGSPLGIRCSTCGSPVQRGFRYCGTCGSEVESPSTGASQTATQESAGASTAAPDLAPAEPGTVRISAPLAERRHVSILFADLVGFTSLAEGRDPEEVRDLQTRYFETCRTVIARYGGTIEKFIGDAVMAMWGAPLAHEDDAERTVRAALELVAAVGSLGQELGLEGLSARSAIVSGEAAVTVGAVGQGMVAGDVVNTAARLQAAARPGTVLVDQATYQTVRGSLSFERAGDQHLPGKRVPVPAWEARQVVALRGGGGRAALPEAPLVGRDSAMALVRDLFHATREDRSVRLLSIFGQAGVGKSRLVWELEKYIDGIVEPIRWHQARSPAYGEGIAFWALAEMVRRRAEIAEGDSPAVGRRRLAAALAQYVPDEAERRWIAPHLAALIGLGEAPSGDRDEAFAAWRTFLERVADVATTILVFDDLHWADEGLLDFIEHVSERSVGRPILLVTVARTELLDRRPGWGAGRRDYVGLHLDPLPRSAMAGLLAGLAPGLPVGLADQFLDQAAGVPLYAVEILRMLVDRGELEAKDGTYVLSGSLERLAVPETLHALIAARLDGLHPDDRALLRDAAVLGQAFRPTALAAVGATTVGEIQPRLRRLVRREFIIPDTDDRSPGQERYRFAEWLVREVAYGALAMRDRRARHLAAGRYYDELGDPELIGAVATHLLAAYRAGPTGQESTELAARATAALRKAADRAFSLHSPEQSLEFLEGALSVVTDDAERAQLREQAAVSAQAAARLKEAAAYARQAIDWHSASGDRSAVARTTARLGAILALGYETEESIAVVRSALEELGDDEDLRDDPSLYELTAGLARSYLLDGRTADAAEWADRALAGAERLDLRTVVAGALVTKGAAYLEGGRVSEGIGLLRTSLAIAEEEGFVVPALRARNSLSVALLTENPHEAFETAGVGLEIARRFGFRDLTIRLASTWAVAALDVGAWDEILELAAELDRADLPPTDRVDYATLTAVVLSWRGDQGAADSFATAEALLPAGEALALSLLQGRRSMAALASGRPFEALTHAEAATATVRPTGFSTELIGGLILIGRAALWAGDLERLENAVKEIEAQGPRGRALNAIVATLRAGIAARHGDARAIDGYVEAATELRVLDVPLQLGLCQLEAASFLPGDSPEAATAHDEARGVLDALGASMLITRLETGLIAEGSPAGSLG